VREKFFGASLRLHHDDCRQDTQERDTLSLKKGETEQTEDSRVGSTTSMAEVRRASETIQKLGQGLWRDATTLPIKLPHMPPVHIMTAVLAGLAKLAKVNPVHLLFVYNIQLFTYVSMITLAVLNAAHTC